MFALLAHILVSFCIFSSEMPLWFNLVCSLSCCCGISAQQDRAAEWAHIVQLSFLGGPFDSRVMSFPQHLEINYPLV